MRDWYPLVTPGGILAGHDYTERYLPTILAVDAFCESINKTPIIIAGTDESVNTQDEYESWYIIKE